MSFGITYTIICYYDVLTLHRCRIRHYIVGYLVFVYKTFAVTFRQQCQRFCYNESLKRSFETFY